MQSVAKLLQHYAELVPATPYGFKYVSNTYFGALSIEIGPSLG